MEDNTLSNGNPEEFYEICVRLLEHCSTTLTTRFHEDAIAVMDAAEVFDPVKAASFSSPESKYKYGCDGALIMA